MSGLPKWRFFIVIFALLAAVLCILVRFAFYVADGNPGQAGRPQNFRERGQILDRNGKILASQIRLYDVYVSPPERDNIPELAAGLAPIVEMNEEDIRARISGARGSFILKRHVSPAVMEAIRDSRLRGVSTRQVPVRVYPEKSLAAQIIGFVGFDYTGLDGIERAFNDELSGEGNNGRGSTVVLTIDANVQYILEKVASSTLRETQAESVMFLAMDSRNGEILGSAVLPGFDPNNHTASDDRTYQNLTALPPYEPGSVFKIFSISALMDSGAISDNTVFTCNGFYEKTFPSGEKVRIECADGQAHGRVGPREIIINSCNVGAAYAADRQGNEAFYQSLLDYGFGKKTGAWVLMETAGLLRDPALWSGRTRQSIAFGQEVAVSALQIMQAASAIANDGILIPPKLVSHIVSSDGKTITDWTNSDNTSRRVIRADTARKMLSYMTDTATEIGTGWRASVEDLHLAVKTGTSQYRDPVTRGYSKTDFIASCVALLPAESPSLVLYAVIVKPRGETYGGRIAAPAIREAAEQLIDYFGIPRGRNPIVIHPGQISLTGESLPEFDSVMPDFTGLSKKALLPLLFRDGIRVELRGEGWVKRQSPPPGTALAPDAMIVLELE